MFYYLILACASSTSCVDLQQSNQLVDYAKSHHNIEESCIAHALRHDWLEAAYQLIITAVYDDQQLSPALLEQIKEKQKKLNKLSIATESNKKYQVISPAFQWAQSLKNVFLDVKPSHRLDAPGCNDLRESVVNITESTFSFSAKCVRSGSKIKILLEFELFGKVVVEESSHNFTPLGRLHVNLKKYRGDIWTIPVKGKKPGNMNIWWEMKEKYEEEISKVTGDIDEEDREPNSGLEDLVNNPNVVIENSYVNGKYVDNTKNDL